MRERVERLSAAYGHADAYYWGSQMDGSAWLVAEGGQTVRRYNELDTGMAIGDPLPIECEAP